MQTMVMQHTWVKHTITPVSTLKNDEGEPVVFVDPDDMDIAEDNSVYGCDVCGLPMVGNVDTNCEGDPEDG